MRVEISMTVRGGLRRLEWDDGSLSGDGEVIRRLEPLIELGRIDVADLLSVVRGAELATAQRVGVVNLDLTEADGSSFPTSGVSGA